MEHLLTLSSNPKLYNCPKCPKLPVFAKKTSTPEMLGIVGNVRNVWNFPKMLKILQNFGKSRNV